MGSGRGSNGRGGGQVGRGGSSSQCCGDGRAGEKTEAEKVRSDATRIRGSYRYRNYGVAPPAAFSKRESERYRRYPRLLPFRNFVVVELPLAAVNGIGGEDGEPDDAPAPAFKPGDYLDDAELKRLLRKPGEEAGLAPGDFADERHLETVIGLVSQTSRRDADKAEEWWLVAEGQGKIFIDLGSDGE